MLTPREQGGGLAEGSRLLQEGLQLLDEREREVDAILEDARERALVIKEEAEQRAQQITADAERQRAELEEQVAALRAEVASIREELATLRAAPRGGASEPADAKIRAAPLEAGEAQDAANAPRWGRQSNLSAAQQAIRTASRARPRWLPPWLPFLIVLLAAAGVVATNVDGQAGTRSLSADDTTASPPSTADSGLTAASVVSSATSIVVAAQIAATATPTSLKVVPTRTTAAASTLPIAGTSAPVAASTLAIAAATLTLPPSGAQVTTPVGLPAEPGPEGPIVAAYTTYATYTVQAGDTLNQVATMFGVSGDTIVRTSGLDNPNLLLPGQVLTIPRDSGWLYRVQQGDTLDLISMRFTVPVDVLLAANNLVAPSVRPGELVFIPDRGTPAPKR
jgi:LysM repeat protein